MASAGASSSSAIAAVDGAVKAAGPSSSASSTLTSPGSVAFSSQPVAPVVVNSHARRPSSDASPSSWAKNSGGGGGGSAAADSTPPPASDDMQQQQQQHSRRSSTAPPSPYSSSGGSETSEEERNPRSKSSSASASKDSSSGVQQAQARQSSGSGGSAPSASQSLPSISGAALLQLRSSGGGSAQSLERMNSIQPAEKRGDEQYEGGASSGANAANSARHYRRSRSRSRERPEANAGGRWSNNNSNNNNSMESVGGGDKDVVMVSRSEDRSSFSGSSDDRELRIMFHGREIYADDLIGLRVAKTFVGHGRFLGQVVKFDEPTSLYTVVYADGDAEELNIDNTIQILIQDEIERADPSLPPVASAYAKEVYPSRPESPEITGAKGPSSSSSAPHPQQQRSQVPPPSVPAGPVQISVAGVVPSAADPSAGAASGPRAALQISEREAQFVVGLFENHALPVLVREGWKIQTSQSGSEQRFYAPQGNFPGAGRVFTSALAVVELIASDNELLSVCFPQNVHSAILSLFPESSRMRESTHHSRKRVPAAGPPDVEPYDMKRQRPGSRDEMMTSDRPTTSHMRPVSASRGPPPALLSSSSQPRHGGGMGDQRGYRHSEDIVMEREREPYAADRVPPVSSERFSGPPREGSRNGGGVRPGSHPDAGEYRRASPGDTRGTPPHRGPPHESSGPRWSGGGGARSALSNNSDPAEYRRQYADSPEWREREMPVRGGSSQYSSGPPPSSYHEGAAPFRSHSRSEDPPYYADRPSASRPGDALPGAYRYQEVPRSPVRRSPSADHFGHRHGSSLSSSAGGRAGPPSAGPEGSMSSSSSSTRRDSVPPEYRNSSTGERMGRGGPPPQGRGDPGSMPPGRGPSFSMMDVDRVSIPRAGVPSSAASLLEHSRVSSDSGQSSKWENSRPSSEHGGYDQPNERGRSPLGSEAPSQSYGSSQQQQHHRHRHQQQQQQHSSHHRHHHQQRVPSSGDNNSYADLSGSGGRAPSADLVQEQRSTASPGSSSTGGGSKQADGKRA